MNNPTETPSVRLGKIARLHLSTRQELNERLENNEPSQRLVEWLNSLPNVQRILGELFDGRPISEQNLSAWKQGGFRDWQRAQQTRALAREFLDEAEELDEELYLASNRNDEDHSSLLDRVANRMALSLLQLFREAEQGEKGPQRTRAMLDISLQLTRLRRGDYQRRRADLAEARREDDLAEEAKAEFEAVKKKTAHQNSVMRVETAMVRADYLRDLAAGTVTPQREKRVREYYANNAALFRRAGIPDLPEGEELAALVAERRASQPKRRKSKAAAAGPESTTPASSETAGQSSPIKASQGG